MPALTLAIPTALTNDAYTKQLSMAVWAALTALIDTSAVDAKNIYTQVINGLKIGVEETDQKKILIRTEDLSKMYSEDDKYWHSLWWSYFEQVRKNKSSMATERYAVGFSHTANKSADTRRLDLFYDLEKLDKKHYRTVVVEWEAYAKITKIKNGWHSDAKAIAPSSAIRKKPSILGKNRELIVEPILMHDFKSLMHKTLSHTSPLHTTLIKSWASQLGLDIKTHTIKKISDQYSKASNTDSPFVIRTRGNSGDIIAVLFHENKKIKNSQLKPFFVVLSTDSLSLKVLEKLDSEFHEIILKKVESYGQDGAKQITYQYITETLKDESCITLRTIKVSNKERPLPDSITLYNVPEDD